MIKAIKIDSLQERVYEVLLENEDSCVKRAVGSNDLERVELKHFNSRFDEDLFVDSNDFFKNHTKGFSLAAVDKDYLFAGNGLIIGYDLETNKAVDTHFSVEDIKKQIYFFVLMAHSESCIV